MPLEKNGVICDHTNRPLFVEDANNILASYVSQYYHDIVGKDCVAPFPRSIYIPTFHCLFDNSTCVEDVVIHGDESNYNCTIV